MDSKGIYLKRKFLSEIPFTYWLILVNVIVFLFFRIAFIFKPDTISILSLQASNILSKSLWWTFITSMFLHYEVLHLFVNMFTLFFLGSLCERIIGRKRFLWIYMLSGIFAGIFFVFFAYFGSFFSWGASVFGGIDVPAMGASGALFGILGVLVMLVPRYRVYLIAGPIILFIVLVVAVQYLQSTLAMILSIFINLLIFFMIFSLFSGNARFRAIALPVEMEMWMAPFIAIVPLVVLSFFVPLPIGNSAHLGGLIVGIISGSYLRMKYPQKIKLLGRIFR